MDAWRDEFAGLTGKMGYLSGLDPGGRSREFIEIMEMMLLTDQKVWEGAVILLWGEMTIATENSDRNDLKIISMVLRLSDRASESMGKFKDRELEEEERNKLNKAYEEYTTRRQSMQA